MTDRELLGAILIALGKLHVAVTGRPLEMQVPVETGYLAIREPFMVAEDASAGRQE